MKFNIYRIALLLGVFIGGDSTNAQDTQGSELRSQ